MIGILIGLALLGIPVGLILKKAGLPHWWLIWGLIPFVNLVTIWVFAFMKWPATDDPPDAEPDEFGIVLSRRAKHR